MSSEAYSRHMVRELKIWSPFSGSFIFSSSQINERAIIFGLYARSYLNSQKYLIEVEAVDLLNLLTDYNSKIAGLAMQEQMVIAEIVSKRYLADLEKQIHDEKLITESQKITADDLLWDAKMAALISDTAAIDTMIAKVNASIQKTQARISELEAYIQIESYNQSNVDIEVAEKTLQSARADLRLLDAANAILKIQADTVSKAAELIDIDLRISGIKREIASTDRQIAEIDSLANNLTIAIAQTSMDQAELPLSIARRDLAATKSLSMDGEITYIDVDLTNREAVSHLQKIDLMNHKYMIKTEDLARGHERAMLNFNQQVDLSTLDVTFANRDALDQITMDGDRSNEISQRISSAGSRASSAIDVARTAAAANITSTLTHVIGKST